MADRDPITRKNRFPVLEMVRLAIPRRTYTNSHMDYIAESVEKVWKRNQEIIKGYSLVSEAPILRHFTMELKPVQLT